MIGSVVPEALLADPPRAARVLYPVVMSNAAYLQQCFSWRGGELFPLWKQRGPLSQVDSYRAILIAQTIPKLCHHLARAQLVSHVQDWFLPLQVGGLRKMGVEFGSHYISTLRLRARHRGVSHAVLYFDIKSAFYQARRQDVLTNVIGAEGCHTEDTALSALTCTF